MALFKPSDIRIIVFLSLLALGGTVLTILQRQGRVSRLELGMLAGKSEYQHIYKSSDLRKSPGSVSPRSAAVTDSTIRALEFQSTEKIDLNHAGIYDFQTLPGIGPVIAERIVAYRDSVGGFKSVQDLVKVKGIGPVKFKAIVDRVTVE